MSSALKPIVVVGSINMDLVASASHIPGAGETLLGREFQTHHGGKGANQAVAAARLGYPVQMIGRVGNDAFGTELRAGLDSEGIDTNGVAVSEGSSGVALIVVTDAGENSIVVAPGANAQVSAADLEKNMDSIRAAGMVLAQLEIPIETIAALAAICSREGVPLMLDPAPAQKLPDSLLKCVSWFTPNETEAAFYLHEASIKENAAIARELQGHGVAGVVLKLGTKGAWLAPANAPAEAIRPFSVQAIDTTGAGDCFNGAFAVGLLLGKGLAESGRFAAAAAAISVTRSGAQPSMPRMSEVEELLDVNR